MRKERHHTMHGIKLSTSKASQHSLQLRLRSEHKGLCPFQHYSQYQTGESIIIIIIFK